MTEQEHQQQVRLDIAKRDISDITHLRQNEAFKRYFMRRIQEEAQKLEDRILSDDELTKDVRESVRQQYLKLLDVMVIMEVDFNVAMKLVQNEGQISLVGTAGNG